MIASRTRASRAEDKIRLTDSPNYQKHSLDGGVFVRYALQDMKKLQLALLALRVPVDFAALLLAAYAAYAIRFESAYTSVRPVITPILFDAYASVTLNIASLAIVIFALTGLYTSRRIGFREELRRIFIGSAAGVLAIIVFMFWSQSVATSRFVILVAWALAFCFVALGRVFIRIIERLAFTFGAGVTKIVLVGSGAAAEALETGFERTPSLGYRIVQRMGTWDAGKVHEADEILLADPKASREEAMRVMDYAETHHMGFKYAADLYETTTKYFDFHDFAGVPLIEYKRTRLEGWGRIYKRVFDILASLFLIILFSPIMLIVALAVKLGSKGPVLFSQKRVGERGRTFTYFKFRSMVVGAHEKRAELEHLNERHDGPMFKVKNDPRVTPVGRFIRKYSLDELPEFFLVLMGRMSLVGPRPHLPEEVAKYSAHHRKVHHVKPGITGLAQVSGRADLHFEDEVRLDLYYIENWSPILDLAIMVKTPFAVLSKKGAA